MATNNLTGENIVLPIYNQDGTSFNGLVLKKSVYESVVMSLGDKITGDVYYPNNALVVTMGEYVEYNGVRYVLVNPPVIVREGMISDNGELKGMTKYSFTFYHPMYMLGNFPFCDVAVSADQQRYLSENKTFAWIGNLVDYVAKINKNLESTEWYCVISDNVQTVDRNKLSEVESFDKNTIAEALKRGYEIWEIPYIISTIASTDPLYAQGKRYLIQYGLPTTEILVENEQHELVPFVFHFGQGVGLKNNSRTPRNNKIVTRIAGYGSEDNIPYGYPQIPYEGGTCQYPLYYGIVGGQRVQLIKHPFTRTHLMPPIYRETVNKKVNPMAVGYDPTIEIKDYYDADNTYENPIKPEEPSYEIHEFEKIKPEFGDNSILGVVPVSNDVVEQKYSTMSSFLTKLRHYMQQTNIDIERHVLNVLYDKVQLHVDDEDGRTDAKQYYFHYKIEVSGDYEKVVYESSNINFEETILLAVAPPAPAWDDEMDDDGNYKQSYFKITIPQLSFDVYASAAVTQEMTVNMRSGACLGCSFPVMVDWDDYKRNFFDEDGNFAPNGTQRDLEKYPNSQSGQIELTLQKETNTFGTLMPNIYQKPAAGDKFVFLGISMPTSYITAAESRLETDMKQYMRDNNVHYFDYPLKFDEKFLVDNIGILNQMHNNVVVRFDYAGEIHALYIKQISIKYENKPLPTYDITLTDDIEIVLNPIGQVTDDVSKLRLALGGGGVGGSISGDYIRKDIDDTAYGLIRLIKGMQVGERFVTGLLGEGGMFRKESDGTTYLECDKLYVRMRAYFDTVEIRKYIHSGGNRIASLAGIKCSRVEYIDANGNVTNDASEATKFRCFFRANNDGQEVTNDFVVGDLAFCKETNASEAQGVEQHGYWRAVVGRNAQGVLTNDGEGWIDLSATDCLSGSDVPIAQDDIIQLGNKTDTTRQGAIIEFVGGADAPSYQIYQGINDYSLNGKNYIGLGYSSQNARAYLNVYGDAYLGDPNESTYIKYNAGTKNLEIKAKISAESTIDGETLAQFISENTWTEEQIDALITAETDPLVNAIDEIRRQVDGSISTWFYDGVPTLENEPASGWTTDDDKNEHLGDLYYDNLTGYPYRFKYDELNRQYSWMRITDTDVTKALADAAKAQDTADHKRRVFVVQPTPPYDAGDLWVNATYPTGNTETNEAQNKYYNDVLRCKTSKASGTTFAIADWSLASKYTDDKALNDFKANQYVTALTNGTISTNITNAQNAADAAQQAADDAQADADAAATAAANAQTSATNANNRLDGWADDGKISPTEKTSLKLEWENVKKEYAQICNDADKYEVSKTDFVSAYTSANSAFQKYTAATPENITISTDYANIAAYYTARQTILDAITTAAKKVADDAQTAADNAQTAADNAQTAADNAQSAADDAQAAAEAADARAAALEYIQTALNQKTDIEGGLILTSLIAMRDGNKRYWSGISGTYQSAETGSGYKGHGIAAWFGGAMVDKEVTTTATDYAKSLFRFDGSGYVAGGNLSWDKSGNVTIQGYSINATTLKVGGSAVATQAALDSYLPLSAGSSKKLTDTLYSQSIFPKTDNTYNLGGTSNYWKYLYVKRIYLSADVYLEYDSTNTAVKLSGSFYATGGITALGAGSGGSGGGIDMAAVWTALGNNTNEQINASHLSTALSGYNPTSNFKTINGNSIIGTGNIVIQTSGGTVTAVKVGTTTYNPSSGVVSLPAYPTEVKRLLSTSFVGDENLNDFKSTGVYGTISSAVIRTLQNYPAGAAGGEIRLEVIGCNNHNGYLVQKLWSLGDGSGVPRLHYRGLREGVWGDWVNNIDSSNIGSQSVSYATSSGTSASSSKLATSRTLWGQSFDGSANVSGNMTDVGSIQSSGYGRFGSTGGIYICGRYDGTGNSDTIERATSGAMLYIQYYHNGGINMCQGGGKVGIGTTSPSYKLHVNGTFYASGNSSIGGTFGVTGLLTANGGVTIPSGQTLTIGDAVLSWDSTNQGIKITKGLYSETFISALGAGSGGSGGVDMAAVWTALGNNTNEQINASHLSTALSGYNPTSNFKTINGNSIIGTGNIVIQSSGGTVTAVKVGSTSYSPTDGVVSLPAYPTTLPANGGTAKYLLQENTSTEDSAMPSVSNGFGVYRAFTSSAVGGDGHIMSFNWGSGNGGNGAQIYIDTDPTYNISIRQRGGDGVWNPWKQIITENNIGSQSVSYAATAGSAPASDVSAWAKADTKPTYTLDEVNDGDTRKLADYLPLSGGTLTGTLNTKHIVNNEYSTGAGAIAYITINKGGNYFGLGYGGNSAFTLGTSNYAGTWTTKIMSFSDDGSVGVGTTSPSYKLHVAGTFYASGNSSIVGTFGVTGATTLSSTLGVSGATTMSSTLGVSGLLTASGGITIPSGKTLTIGDAVLSWDSTNQGIKITKGLYSETFISALGAGSAGSGGVDMNTVWTALANNTNEQINASHLSTALSTYATQSWVESQGYTKTSGTVTAVKVGTTTYNPSNGVVSLPAYPTEAQRLISTTLAKNSNINDFKTTGVYGNTDTTTINTFLNKPTGTPAGEMRLEVIGCNNNTGYLFQKYWAKSGTSWGVYIRTLSSSSWSDWAEVIHSGNIGTQSVSYASSAGSVAWGNVSGRPTNVSSFTNDSGYITSSGSCNYATSAGTATSASHLSSSSKNEDSCLANAGNFNFYCTDATCTAGGGDGYILAFGWSGNYQTQIYVDVDPTYVLSIRHRDGGGTWKSWKQIITANNIGSQSVNYATSSGTSSSCTGNAASATQLQTSRTIWGQSFNGTANVSGAISGATTISASSNVSVGGTLGVTGNTTLSGTLSVSKAATLSSTLGVTGATTLSSTLGVSGATTMSGKLTMNKSNIELVNTSTNDGIWVEMKGVSYDWGIATGSGNVNRGIIDFSGAGWMLYFDASNTYCEYGNFICSGGVTALSDIRHKSIVDSTKISVEQIARMRSVKFLWNDGRNDDAIHVGSIAQDWQSILPEVVIRKDDKDGTLSLNYGVAALVSVITTARKVVDHERRIKELEKENERLRFEVEQLKIA